ncbi:MAG: hypothetical protein LBF12_05805 [Christensenellaceae bacterium]|nr:hypothetical protein [Christensenellaceae bacterium]
MLGLYNKALESNVQQYRIQFETEGDLIEAQSILVEYTIECEDCRNMLISFISGNF